MFLKFIKNFGLKNTVKKLLGKYHEAPAPGRVKTVGLLIDERHFNNREAIIAALVKHGISKEDIDVLGFKERVRAKEVVDCCYYTRRDISPTGHFFKEDAALFVNEPFDLLINYYDTDSLPLMLVTLKSKAKFKAGFSMVDMRLNHFMVNADATNHKQFMEELIRYLQILNKI